MSRERAESGAQGSDAANSPSRGSTRRAWALGAAILVAALVIPPSITSAALARSGGASSDALRAGVWCLKLALFLLAIMVAAGPAFLPSRATPAQAPRSSASPPPAAAVAVLGALLLLGAVLRLYDLGNGLWLDEIYTVVTYVRTPMSHILTVMDSQNQHVLYSALARMAHEILSDERVAVRLPAALFGIASLWATWRLGRAIASLGEAMLATALLSVSYHHVWFSQNARGYTGMLLFTILGTICLLRLLNGTTPRPRRDVWLYALWMALAIYVHVTAAVVVTAHALVVAIELVRRPALRERGRMMPLIVAPLLAAVLSLTLYAIVLPQLLGVVLRPTLPGVDVEWQSGRWMVVETLRSLGSVLPGGLVTLGVASVVLVTGVVSYWRQGPATLLVMTVPGALTAVAIVAMRHNLWPRFFFFSAAFAVLLAVRGGVVLCRGLLGKSRGSMLAWTGGALMAAASAFMVPRAWAPKQDFEGAVAFVEASRQAGDVVVAMDIVHDVTSRYLGRDWPAAITLADVTALEATDARTWLLYTFPIGLRATQPALVAHLEREYRVAKRLSGTVGGGDIVVMMREADPGSGAPAPSDSTAP